MKYCFLFFLLASLFLIACSNSDIVKKDNKYYVSPPNTPWVMTFPAGDLKLDKANHKNDWERSYYFSDSKGFIVSFQIQPSFIYTNPKLLRDDKIDMLKSIFRDIKVVTKKNTPDYAAAEYTHTLGKNVEQYFMRGDFIKNNWGVSAVRSKPNATEIEKVGFEEFFNSISFAPKDTLIVNYKKEDSIKYAVDFYFLHGSLHLLQGNIINSIESYEKVMENEEAFRKSNKDLWYVLLDNLASAYRLKGDPYKAKVISEGGLKVDPEYPIFYYNIACYYAEINYVDKAIENLRLAYKYKRNKLSLSSFPDPVKDESFSELLKNEKFQIFLVDELGLSLI